MTLQSPNNTAHTAARSGGLTSAPLGRWNFTGKGVLAVLLLSIVLSPLLERTENGKLIESILLTLVLGIGALAVGGRRRTLLTATSLGLPAVAARWLHQVSPESAPAELYLALAVLTMGYVVWHFLRFIATTRRVDSGVLCTGIAAFLLLALLWAFLYQLIDQQIPGSFVCSVGSQPTREMKGLYAYYFSLVTLCTVGFGDIAPASDVARMCAMLEGVTGVFFVALLISRLVSLYGMQQPDAPAAAEQRMTPPAGQ